MLNSYRLVLIMDLLAFVRETNTISCVHCSTFIIAELARYGNWNRGTRQGLRAGYVIQNSDLIGRNFIQTKIARYVCMFVTFESARAQLELWRTV